MIKHFTAILALLACLNLSASSETKPSVSVSVTAPAQDDSFYNSLSRLLQKYVKQGQVNYRGLQKDKPALDRLVQEIGKYNVKSAAAAEKKAFYINAYNTLVLYQVLENYPVKSVMDVPGFFDKQKFKVAGEQMTLNELEKGKLLLPSKDSRVHFALVCAAKSCPPLLNRAYLPEKVEEQLQAQTTATLNHPQFIRVKEQKREVEISEIFKWYEGDFLAESPSVIGYINQYRNKPVPKGYKVKFYGYDWSLNDISK